jgi:ribosome-associated toxin RatA of RatAB toxin-antitoxin module
MQKIQRSADVPYSCEQMFALIEAVDQYPLFLPLCSSARVIERDAEVLQAQIVISKGPISQAFTTRNQLNPPFEMTLELVSGPFRHLKGLWQLTPHSDSSAHWGCRVYFELGFDLKNPLLRMTLGPLFEQVAGGQVDAFVERAHRVYGEK